MGRLSKLMKCISYYLKELGGKTDRKTNREPLIIGFPARSVKISFVEDKDKRLDESSSSWGLRTSLGGFTTGGFQLHCSPKNH